MPAEPASKRTVVFVDSQNLYHSVREAFGYTYPNFDILALAGRICQSRGWDLLQVRFYTGIPDPSDNAFWHHFWSHKLAALGRQGVWVYSRSLRYRNRRLRLPDGTERTHLAGEEKGIDVRIAIDVIRMAHRREYDVALLFSQDQDLSEVTREIRAIAKDQDRWIKVSCAFPWSPTVRQSRGVDLADWIRIDRATYDACVDRRDCRPKRPFMPPGV